MNMPTWLCSVLLLAAFGAAPAGAAGEGEELVVHAAGSSMAAEVPERQAPLSAEALEALVGPVALYPDDLLAIVLPASTYPLQVVQAARLLDDREAGEDVSPEPDWDPAVVALLNYPEVLERLNRDLDWTWRLGQAVLNQEEDVIDAVSRFREAAYAAGHLRSDPRQRVTRRDGALRIEPTDPETLYVPDYQAEAVQRRYSTVVYRYLPDPYPVYYYPYPVGHYLTHGEFWGLTSAFSIGWHTRHLHVHLHDQVSHPYFGRKYAHRNYRYWRAWRHHDHRRCSDHAAHRWHGKHDRQGDRPREQDRQWTAERRGRALGPLGERNRLHALRAAQRDRGIESRPGTLRSGGVHVYDPADGIRRYGSEPTPRVDRARQFQAPQQVRQAAAPGRPSRAAPSPRDLQMQRSSAARMEAPRGRPPAAASRDAARAAPAQNRRHVPESTRHRDFQRRFQPR